MPDFADYANVVEAGVADEHADCLGTLPGPALVIDPCEIVGAYADVD